MIKGIAHVALYTAKFEETIHFYENVFQAKVFGYFKTDVRACWLLVGDSILEIFESDDYNEGGFKHIAIECDDVDELFHDALNKGAQAHVYPKDITLHLNETINARIAFIKGINGEQIELFEKKK